MNYQYCHNPNDAVPVMLVDKYIGKDAKGVTGIDGSRFASEVLALKNSGKKAIEVWINSKGGNVADGFSMYGALKGSGLDVTTVNMGCVDSTAGWVYQAGNKRVWNNYALGLVHKVSGAGSAQDKANNSIATMLAGKTKMSKEQVLELMGKDDYMDSETALTNGFCDEVTNSSDLLEFTNSSDITEVTNYGDNQIQKLLPKIKKMSSINILLELDNEASETAQTAAIKGILTARNEAIEQTKTLTADLATKNSLLAATNTELTEARNTILTAKNDALKAEGAAYIATHKGKRLTDKPEVLEMWTNVYIANPEQTKKMIESMALNISAPDPLKGVKNEGGASYFSADAGAIMLQKSEEAEAKRKGKK